MCHVKLITAHRILITAGIAFFVFYALVQTRVYVMRGGGVDSLIQAVVAAAIAVGLIVYYRTLKQWGRR
jgi:hypothetical protein